MGGGRGGVGVLSNFCASAPHSHSFSSLLTTSPFLIYDSFMHYHSKFLGERNVSIQRESLSAKMRKIPEQNTTRDLFPALLLLYLVQLLHFWLEQSFGLSITISVGKLFPNLSACAGGEVKAGVQVCLAECWTLSVSVCSCVSAHTRESFCLSWGMLCVSAFPGGSCCICFSWGMLLYLPFLGDPVVSAPGRVCGHCSDGRC